MLSKSSRATRLCLAVAAGLSLVSSSSTFAADEPFQIELQRLGFSGNGGPNDGYYRIDNYQGVLGQFYEKSAAVQMNEFGQVIGWSDRWFNQSISLGRDAWLWTGAVNQILGFQGDGYRVTNQTGSGHDRRTSNVQQLNSNGLVIGTSNRLNGTNTTSFNLGVDTWAWNGSATVLIGLIGTDYQVANFNNNNATRDIGDLGFYRSSSVLKLTESGYAIGTTERVAGSGGPSTNVGFDAWFVDIATPTPGVNPVTKLIGLTGATYEVPEFNAGKTFRSAAVKDVNELGFVVGTTQLANAPSFTTVSLKPQDAWITDGKATTPVASRIGLTSTEGAEYQVTVTGPGTYRRSDVDAINDSKLATGTTQRRAVVGGTTLVDLGQDAWAWDGSAWDGISAPPASVRIGRTGTDYETTNASGTYRKSTFVSMNETGSIVGYTERRAPGVDPSFTPSTAGQDAWVWKTAAPNTTTPIGLTGPDYEIASNGGTFRFSTINKLNDAGFVIGTTRRPLTTAGPFGQDPWVYLPGTGITQQVGLTGADGSVYEVSNYPGTSRLYRMGEAQHLNELGYVAGSSQRRVKNAAGTALIDLGQDSWVWNGTETKQIGLTGTDLKIANYQSTGEDYQTSSVTQLNELGDAIGTSKRLGFDGSTDPFADFGLAGWFFDSVSETTVALPIMDVSSTNKANTVPQYLSDAGSVLGYFSVYDNANVETKHVFWWKFGHDLFDLGELLDGSTLAAEGWQSLASVYGDGVPGGTTPVFGEDPRYILGIGKVTNMTTTDVQAQAVYLATALPEPGTVGMVLAAAGAMLLGRRRRSA
jgi:hypothetical protein